MSQPLFEVVSHVTPESCMAQARARKGQHGKLIWVINLMTAVCVAVMWIIQFKGAIWMTVLLGILLLQALLQETLGGWRAYAARNESVREIRLAFSEAGIWVRTRVEESHFDYSAVTGLCENGKFLVVLMRHHTPLVMAKSEITGGTADELVDCLKERTGLSVRPLRA